MTSSSTTSPFDHTLTNADRLTDHYREPSSVVIEKAIEHIDAGARAFIEASPFVLIGTSDAAGNTDVSPKGGHAGFVHVLDDTRLAIPDLNGNNRLDTLRNVIDNSHVGLLFLVPERGETLRVNGNAWVSVDDELLNSFTDEYRRPASVIAVEATEVFLHCAKCVRRGGLWQPDSWGSNDSVPNSAQIFAEHIGMSPEEIPAFTETIESSYVEGLAQDAPTG